jgi:RNA polymerase sigma factor (sigma-70 family)
VGRDDCYLVALVADIAAKRQTALGRLFVATRRPMTSIAYSILNSTLDAEEIVCDTLMYVWQHAERFDRSRGSVMTWLNTITRNRSIDMLRKRRRLIAFEDLGQSEISALRDSFPMPDQFMHAFEGARALHDALHHLSPTRQTVLELAFLDEMTHEQISVALSMPAGTVKSNIRRGLRTMQNYIERDQSCKSAVTSQLDS